MTRTFQQQENGGKSPHRLVVWSTAAGLLLLPLVAMQFTTEVNWTLLDFVVFGGMLLVACGAYELVVQASGNTAYRLGAGIVIVGVFLQVWANLAVGIIGNENHPANLMFLVIPVVGVLGAGFARLEARGMARTLGTMAVVQALIGLMVWFFSGTDIFVMTWLFVLVWLAAARLFRQAAATV